MTESQKRLSFCLAPPEGTALPHRATANKYTRRQPCHLCACEIDPKGPYHIYIALASYGYRYIRDNPFIPVRIEEEEDYIKYNEIRWKAYDCECRFLIMQFYTITKSYILYHIISLYPNLHIVLRQSTLRLFISAGNFRPSQFLQRPWKCKKNPRDSTQNHHQNTSPIPEHKSARQHHEVQTSCTAVPE